jgi:hypothetical protein
MISDYRVFAQTKLINLIGKAHIKEYERDAISNLIKIYFIDLS